MARFLTMALLACAFISTAWASDQSALTRTTMHRGELSFSFSSPIVYRAEHFSRPPRLVVNLYAVKAEDRELDEITHLSAPWLDGVKTETILGDSLRVILFLKEDAALNVYGVPPTDSVLITPNEHADQGLNGLGTDESRGPAPDDNGSEGNPPKGDTGNGDTQNGDTQDNSEGASPGAANDGRIRVDRLNFENGANVCRLQCDLARSVKPQAFLLTTDPAKPRLVFDLPHAAINPPEQTIAVPDNPLVSRIRTGVFDHTVARVVLDLKQKISFAVSSDNDGTRVVLSIVPLGAALAGSGSAGSAYTGSDSGAAPPANIGALQGRTIVIDPGHGGHDTGTTGFGFLEKNVALDISRRLYSILKGAGVNAVLTRDDDRFIPLPDRPAVANRMGADAFVAIHLNSTGSVRNIWSGTETYYHFQDPICRELARDVQAHLVQAIGLPDRGARSDTTIAKRLGFSVLRNCEVPAILVEVGYLNHPTDSGKLAEPEFRQRAAEGIMAGLASYFGRSQVSSRRRG